MDDIIPLEVPQKQCKGPCGETYPATTDFFYKSPRGIFNVGPYCKKCHVQLNTERRRNLPSEKKERMKAKGRAHYYAHKERIISRRKGWYQANRDYALEKDRQFRIEHPEILAARWQRWYQTENGKEHSRIRVHNREARRRSAEGNYTYNDIQEQHKRQKGKCYWCNNKLIKYHIDHIIPLARGGTNWPDNLVLSCPRCNMSRQDKLPHEWPQGNRLL